MSYTATRLHGYSTATRPRYITPGCRIVLIFQEPSRGAGVLCCGVVQIHTYLTYWGDYLSYNLYCNLLRYKMYKAQDVLLTTYCINIYSQIFPI